MRIGTLGAARITRRALLEAAAAVDGVDVVAVAARDRNRAEAFAEEHGIAQVYDSYDALLADPAIDAVYNPLPNSAHGEWSLRALAAGKHVLCEKPLALNAVEAAEVVAAAERAGKVLMEALHWRYHAVAGRVANLVGRLGPLRRAEAVFLAAIGDESDIRYQLALGGGATMDLGCYCIHALRTIVGEEPTVRSAQATERPPGVDLSMAAELVFPSGVEGRIRCGFDGPEDPLWYLVFEGDAGRIRLDNYVCPQFGNRLTAEFADGDSIDEEVGGPSSYACQLAAFRDAATSGTAPLTGGADAIANAAAIDAVYLAAGLPLR